MQPEARVSGGSRGGWRDAWMERFYRSRPGWTDGTTDFHALCRAAAPAGAKILEVGAGPTNPTSAFLATLGEVHGLDVDDEVRGNVHLASSGVIEGDRYPFPDAFFDVAVSNYVVEHVGDAAVHLAEIHRVLRPGGRYLFRTPNLFTTWPWSRAPCRTGRTSSWPTAYGTSRPSITSPGPRST